MFSLRLSLFTVCALFITIFTCIVLVLVVITKDALIEGKKKPNIIVIMADDLGFNDVSFRGSDEFPTPNIDALAYNGVILNRFYTAPLCSPSRASFMTGKYPSSIGMQHFVILPEEPWGLSLKDPIMPEFFKNAGYKTHLVGKWHLGFYQEQYVPVRRGFDSHFGYLGAHIDYYNYMYKAFYSDNWGYDMRKNLSVNYDIKPNSYITETFTEVTTDLIKNHDQKDPLFLLLTHLAPHSGNEDNKWQAPDEEIRKFAHIQDPERRVLAAMVSMLDKSVGHIMKALKDKGILDNTIVVFYSDNGAPTLGTLSTKGSNYPLRGQKQSPWEGASRTAGLIYSPLLKKKQRVINDWIHVADLLPTLTAAAGIKVKSHKFDGINQWPTISEAKVSNRKEVVTSLDNVSGYSGYIYNGWKLVNGTDTKYNSWYGNFSNSKLFSYKYYANMVFNSMAGKTIQSLGKDKLNPPLSSKKISLLRLHATVFCDEFGEMERRVCDPSQNPCLFDLYKDPCELNNLAEIHPDKLYEIQKRFKKLVAKAKPSRRREIDPKASAEFFNYTLHWWQPDGQIE